MEQKQGNILVVDDNENILTTLKQSLKYEFNEIETIKNPNHLPTLIESGKWDVVLLDMNFSAGVNTGNEGLFWLKKIKEIDKNVLVILITAYADIDIAVRGIKEGAHDFITKPWDIDKLIVTLRAALKLRLSQLKVQQLESKQKSLQQNSKSRFDQIIGSSQSMLKVFKTIRKVATTEANVLILGENGSGKELAAREIHQLSNRKNEIFMSVDLGSLSESLFESELFGYKKGAFTDAKEDRIGRLEAASGGTLFLDEIGNLSLNLQSKLLTILQNREVTPVGSSKPIAIDVRIICATNKNLHEMVEQNLFREDLLYRINTIQLELPPLRERDDDIGLLADFFLNKYKSKYEKAALKFSQEALDAIKQHHWPGNIRELKHAVEKAVILSESNILAAEDFLFTKRPKQNWDVGPSNRLVDVEKFTIKKVLDKHKGNLSKAAKELNISRTTLYLKIEKHGL